LNLGDVRQVDGLRFHGDTASTAVA
jgi:hypothetical protein